MMKQKKTHCLRGHERTEENVTKNGECKVCRLRKLEEWKNQNKERVSEFIRNRYKLRAEKFKEQRTKHKDSRKVRDREYYKENREDRIRYSAEWRESNLERCNAKNKEIKERSRNSLSDGYVAGLLRVKVSDIPPEVVELKRLQIQLKRELKNAANQHH